MKSSKHLFAVPPDIDDESTSSDVTVSEGEDALLSCRADGHPKPKVTWLREDKAVFPAAPPPDVDGRGGRPAPPPQARSVGEEREREEEGRINHVCAHFFHIFARQTTPTSTAPRPLMPFAGRVPLFRVRMPRVAIKRDIYTLSPARALHSPRRRHLVFPPSPKLSPDAKRRRMSFFSPLDHHLSPSTRWPLA